MKQLPGIFLSITSGILFLGATVSLIFYKWFYLDCPGQFNEIGKYYDSETFIMYDSDSFVWLPIGVALLVCSVILGLAGFYSIRNSNVSDYKSQHDRNSRTDKGKNF